MTREHLTVPEQNVREYAHGLAFKLACEQLASIADIKEQCRKSGAKYIPAKKVIIIDHLNRSYQIGFPGGEVSFVNSVEAVSLRDKILLLHYFTLAYLLLPGGEGKVELALGHAGIGARGIVERPVLAVYDEADTVGLASKYFH